jgi:hypothetical protein
MRAVRRAAQRRKPQAWEGRASLCARFTAAAFVVAIAGCTSVPAPVAPIDEGIYGIDTDVGGAPTPAPMVESPPIEPAEPSLPSPLPGSVTPSATSPAAPQPQSTAPPPTIIVAPAPPAEPTEDQEMLALLADLQRFGTMQNDELKRELTAAAQALGRQRTDVNRVRVAVLYTLLRTSAQDDQRALQLFENVARSAPPTSAIHHLAAVLQAQVVERLRAVRDEQQKADAAIQKLEALRAMERSLLRDRVRSGGGEGGSAGGSGR